MGGDPAKVRVRVREEVRNNGQLTIENEELKIEN
jgi:hypothetical protein